MDEQKLVKLFLSENYGAAGRCPTAKELAENHGVRMRQTKETPAGCWEVSTTYFYENQNSNARVIQLLREFAAQHFMKVVAGTGFSGQGRLVPCADLLPAKNEIAFNMRPWPQTSWATSYVRFEV